jgi:hypothetical protein
MPNEMPQEVVSLGVAREDFARMCTARRLKLEDSDWSDAERETFQYISDTICGAICTGQLLIDQDDDPVLVPTGAAANVPTKIKFRKATGTTLLAMDGKIGGAKQFAAYADMAGIDKSHFGKLQYWDIEVLAKLFTLFFQVR